MHLTELHFKMLFNGKTIRVQISTYEHLSDVNCFCFRIDPVKADVFSLGAVLHTLIFRRLPFADDLEATSDAPIGLKVTMKTLPNGHRVPVQSLRKLSGSNQFNICCVTVHVMHR